jgi:methylaspartate mutase epsilon subunit
VLRHALEEEGYAVDFLGIQNSLRDFREAARIADVVMISTLDGHSRLYIAGFANTEPTPLWYIGGNLSVEVDPDIAPQYRAIGFHRVFPGFVDATDVLRCLRHDLAGRPPRRVATLARPPHRPSPAVEEASGFPDGRTTVLAQWPTGASAISLDDNAAFLATRPSLADAQRRAQPGRPLVQPRSGLAPAERQLAHFRALREEGADVLSFQIDSLTRFNDHAAVQAVLDGQLDRRTTLNGYPMVNYGVSLLRSIAGQVDAPLQTRHSTRDPRLLAEISYAGGVTGFEGGCISYNIPYYRDYPLAASIRRWQYVDRLTGWYARTHGIVLDREFFGVLTATLMPPSLGIAVNLIEMLLSVGEGVRSVSLGYAEQGCRTQDVAAVRTLGEMAPDLLRRRGYDDVLVSVAFHQYMAAFPVDRAKAEQVICGSAQTAAASGCTRILTKTPAEPSHVPNLGNNLRGLQLVRAGLDHVPAIDERAVKEEMAVIRAEVEQLLASVLRHGDGHLDTGVIRAFAAGALDVPFAPSRANRGKVLGIRDEEGAVRFLDPGDLELSADLRAFHRDKVDRRRRTATASQLVAHDVRQIPAGQFDAWPLDC